MADPNAYDEAMPHIQEHLEKYQRALSSVRLTYHGRPVEEVREALTAAFEAEGLNIWTEVADDAARLIANEE